MKFVILVLLFVSSINTVPIYPDVDFSSKETIERINSLNTTWKAGNNLDGLDLSMVKKLFMSSEEMVTPIKNKAYFNGPYSIEQLKGHESFDSRSKWASGNESWSRCDSIGKIYDQGLCSPSWIYASVGQIADRICIKNVQIKIDVEATIDYLMSGRYDCNNKFNSADMVKAFQYWYETGIFVGHKKKCLPFSKYCNEYSYKADDFYKFYTINYYQKTNQSDIQLDILNNGPITFLIDVYSDLIYYKTGVYQRTSDVKLGSHVVKVIGWGTENGVDYWLLANSWGTKWGENGFFKIKRDIKDGNGILKQHLATEFDYGSPHTSIIDRQQVFLKFPKISKWAENPSYISLPGLYDGDGEEDY